MADTIFRFTGSSDTISGLASTEKIIFNTGIVPDSTGKLTRTGFRMGTDLNPHPNPDTALNPIQDSLLGVVEITIAGYFINHNNTLGPRNLWNWKIGGDQNSDYIFGRFGLVLSTMAGLLSLTPTTGVNGTGYFISEVFVEDTETPRTEVGFIVKLLRNGTITTVS